MAQTSDPSRRNDPQVEFLLADLETALTFLDVSVTTGIPETARRTRQKAREAHDTVVRLMAKKELTAEQDQAIRQKLELVRARLAAGGEEF
jgi:hypothetical protein